MKRHRVVPSWPQFLPVAWAILGTLLGSGAVWQYMNHNLEAVRLEKDLYERLSVLNAEILAELPQYAYERDEHMTAEAERAPGMSHHPDEEAAHANAYNRLKQKLSLLVKQYNRLEFKLAKLQGRSPQWLVLALHPPPPTNMAVREVGRDSGRVRYRVTWINPQVDPLILEEEHDVHTLGDPNWRSPNRLKEIQFSAGVDSVSSTTASRPPPLARK